MDPPPRAQLIGAMVVGVALVACGVYLWRRSHGVVDPRAVTPPSASALAVEDSRAPEALLDAGGPKAVTLSEARILACHDKGSRKTPAEQCDHVVTVEQALVRAISETASCSASSTAGGTIEYVADVSFLRRKVKITLPRSGRSLRDRRVVEACAVAVREAMDAVPLESADHEHSRYKISVTATYHGKTQG